MEKQLFDWEELQSADIDCMQFGDCTLKVAIPGVYERGEKFGIISINYETGVIKFWRNAESPKPEYTFKLKLSIGEVV